MKIHGLFLVGALALGGCAGNGLTVKKIGCGVATIAATEAAGLPEHRAAPFGMLYYRSCVDEWGGREMDGYVPAADKDD